MEKEKWECNCCGRKVPNGIIQCPLCKTMKLKEEKSAKIVANLILIIGIITSIIIFFVAEDSRERLMLLYIIPTMLFALIFWSALKTLYYISANIRDINRKTKYNSESN